ncbi:MAG: hypothetical protein KDJ35_01310 [Alphaproteobacteria bacterium]|nr:hypothetical protein [Alphaproteobacteria bacterium]
MAGPLNGVGVNQQLPIANAYQQGPNNTAGIRDDDDVQAQQNVVQPEGAEPAEAQTTATDDQNSAVSLRGQADALEGLSGNDGRGSIVDVLV